MGSTHSLATYFLPRIKWLQDGSQILFGKVRNDCIYVLIDTSHSMKDKLVFVKDKIIQFIQVRWSRQFMHLWACVYHGYISTNCHCHGQGRGKGEFCTQKSTGKPFS